MFYNFDIIGVTPILTFFNYQQQVEQNPKRSKAYLGSYECSLDAFIRSTEMIPQKPEWDWDEVVTTMVNFWLKHSDNIQHWKHELNTMQEESLIVARITNFQVLRNELESLLD